MKNSPDHGTFETIIDNVRRLFDNFVGMFRRQPQQSVTALENSSHGEPQSNTQDGQPNIPIMRQPSVLDSSSSQGEQSNQQSKKNKK